MEFIAQRGESWRVDRLVKASKIFCTIVGINRNQLDLLVTRVIDHKGDLMVHWLEIPTERFMRAFEDAWKLCGEQTCWHYYTDQNGDEHKIADWMPIA